MHPDKGAADERVTSVGFCLENHLNYQQIKLGGSEGHSQYFAKCYLHCDRSQLKLEYYSSSIATKKVPNCTIATKQQ